MSTKPIRPVVVTQATRRRHEDNGVLANGNAETDQLPQKETEMKETWDWAILDDDGVVDRFRTSEEASAALRFGGYPDECRVAFSEDPGAL